ncbi:hypothetical protein H4Q26_002383 [Puccinia striiformis f. sp. tritici PST-130]|nr:hypothetical protein H4Q26_002383 [Puccinia striiformis f. sp. tritici PST-130]
MEYSNYLNFNTGESQPGMNYSNYLGETQAQESQLLPSQVQGTPSVGLFFEETQVNPAANADIVSPNDLMPPIINTTPVVDSPTGVSPEPVAKLQLVELDYELYVDNLDHLLTGDNRAKAKKNEKIFPARNAIPTLNTDLLQWQWDNLKIHIFNILGPTRKNLRKYIDKVEQINQLRWHLYIPNSHVYPAKKNYLVNSHDQFLPFAQEVARKPPSKVVIRLEMEDKGAKAKCQADAKHQDDSLAIAVGEEEGIEQLERERARLILNKNADVNGDPVGPWVVKLRAHLARKCQAKSSECPFLQHPVDPNLVLRVTHDALWLWARVLYQKSLGNVTDHNRLITWDDPPPPQGDLFKWEPRSTLTPSKDVSLHHRASKSSSSRSSCPVTPTPNTTVVTKKHAHSVQPTRMAHSPSSDSTASGAKAGASPISVSLSKGKQKMDSLIPLLDELEQSSDINLLAQGTYESPDRSEISRSPSIEYLNKPSFSSERPYMNGSPSRKLARSPNGYPVHAFRSMSVRRANSPSPTRKHPTVSAHRLPLTDTGRALGMTDFLVHCNIRADNQMCLTLISGHCIHHWSFFQGQTPDDLIRIGFPRGPATLISNGASELEATMVTPEARLNSEEEE